VLDRIVDEMSHWKPDSDLARFNQARAGSWHQLPEDFHRVLTCALAVAKDSSGAYDPTAGALVNLWGFGAVNRYAEEAFRHPGDNDILMAKSRSGWQKIECRDATREVCQPGGIQLDFSSVAKGYAVDKVAGYIERQGIRNFLVEVGGELRGAGMKPDGQPWWVELEQPMRGENGAEPVLLALHGLSVATSGDYRRFFIRDGNAYSHTIDPRTGSPLSNGIASVTVLHEQCMQADALSTAIMVLGVGKGMRFAEEKNLAARILVRQAECLVEHVSSAFAEMLQ
jgi:thiamine biosynthesis lipoprotein